MDDNKIGCSFVEFIEQEKEGAWIDALRVYANVKSPIEEKSLEEWRNILSTLKNKPIVG